MLQRICINAGLFGEDRFPILCKCKR